MSSQTFWLGRGAAVLVLAALLGAAWLIAGTSESPLRLWLRGYERRLAAKLRFLRAKLTTRRVLLAQVAISIASLAGAAWWREPTFLAVLIPALFVPQLLIERDVARRAGRVEDQIEAWLNAVANALRASPSLGEAMASSIALVPAPISEEIDVLVKEYELGTPLDRALDHLSERIPSKTMAGTTLALKVARRSGGNLPEMLESAAVALRELARLEGVVRTKTAEGKAQAFVIGAIPVPLVLLVQWSDPHFFDPLVGSFAGKLVIAGALVLWAVAILLARKILQVDI